ncbi:MAG: NTP transferase domain-containing protein [Arcicella sp.]|nr:NTP transferase domain-containing protein [Arcicella sp.]
MEKGVSDNCCSPLHGRGGGATDASGEVYGLILSGGLSTRMGEDKRLIHYHEKSQEEYIFESLSPYCSEVYVSLNKNQTTILPHIFDTNLPIKSPIVGILSAFDKHPEMAWLVVACDMPFVNQEVIKYLIKHRNPAKFATAFINPEEQFPEPLLTIYEPKIFQKLQEAVKQGKKSPMKVLQRLEVELLEVIDNEMLMSVNTVLERERITNNPK